MNFLKHIFSRNNHKGANGHHLAQLDGFVLQQEYFHSRLRQERLRAERSGSPLSLIIIDIGSCLDFLVQENGLSPRDFLRYVGGILQSSTRESDVKGWYQTRKVALLAPDTDESGTQALLTNLLKKIMAYSDLNSHFQEGDLKSFLSIYTFNGKQDSLEPPSSDARPGDSEETVGRSGDGYHGTKAVASKTAQDFLILTTIRKHHKLMKRTLDILLSSLFLILVFPLFLLIAIIIKIDSPGPIFFRQKRVGKLGRPFTFYKFRSMRHNCDETVHRQHVHNLMNNKTGLSCVADNGDTSYKLVEDNRITRFGCFLRKTSIDELPQLINVLKGDMSLVGPRPHPVYEVDLYCSWHCHRLQVKPGITGLGQVSGRYNKDYEDVFRLDCQYLKNTSLFQDLKILFKTIPAVFARRGAL